jgi:hypothetical protein
VYYSHITEETTLSQSTGVGAVIPPQFLVLSSLLISRCSFIQKLIQEIVFISHGAELLEARQALDDFPNPKARIEFLCSFSYPEDDPVVSKVFEYSKLLFHKLYTLRNILAHESWSSSNDHAGSVLFVGLGEEARLLMASGRVWHKPEATPQEVYDATIRYIRSVEVVSANDLEAAVRDSDLCAWMLSNTAIVLNEKDPARKEVAREAFIVFQGTAHLFNATSPSSTVIKFNAHRTKTIT